MSRIVATIRDGMDRYVVEAVASMGEWTHDGAIAAGVSALRHFPALGGDPDAEDLATVVASQYAQAIGRRRDGVSRAKARASFPTYVASARINKSPMQLTFPELREVRNGYAARRDANGREVAHLDRVLERMLERRAGRDLDSLTASDVMSSEEFYGLREAA